MGCGSCGSTKNGLPGGCKDNGACKSGSCNRLNVHDWLSLIPVADFSRPFPFVEISFNHGSRKDYYRATNPLIFEKGDYVTLEAQGGFDVGVVSVTGELVKLQMKKKGVSEKSEDIKRILHKSTEAEIAKMHESKKDEKEMMVKSRVIARYLKLDMKIAEVEMQADGKKATFFYTAEDRVDFRELIKQFASDFKVKIEMRQIGIRQEAAKVGGIGSCGRELCCSTWLNDFKSVSTTAARYQNLSINQTKLSGQCGRLKCCLNFELDTYMDALRVFPDHVDRIKTKAGVAYLQKKDIFKNLMWFSFEKSNTLYPLTIERVKEIAELNKNNVFPEELQAVEVIKKDSSANKSDYVDVVGEFSLKGLEKASKKKKQKEKAKQSPPRDTKSTISTDSEGQTQKPNPNQKNRPNQNPNQKSKPNPNQQNKANPNANQQRKPNPNQQHKNPQAKPTTENQKPLDNTLAEALAQNKIINPTAGSGTENKPRHKKPFNKNRPPRNEGQKPSNSGEQPNTNKPTQD